MRHTVIVNASWFKAAPIILDTTPTRIQILQRISSGAWPDPLHQVNLFVKLIMGLVYEAMMMYVVQSLLITFTDFYSVKAVKRSCFYCLLC